ncbi:MAG: amino acid permease [Verrucomicrobia bacterium]|nr:amino acid permease [Verrucomicrobiota bacterium]
METAEPSRRKLGLVSATALVVASMIGTGVFTTSGFLLADLKSPASVLAVWILGGVMATLGALSYGALARRIPESGGEYLFLSKTLHPAAGYIAGWISLLVGFSAPLAAAAYGFGEYTQTWFPASTSRWTGTFLILIVSLVHSLDVRGGAMIQNSAVLLKVLLIGLFVGLAIMRLPSVDQPPSASVPISVYGVSLVWISFSYAGWNAAIYIGGEVRNPEKNLPRSLLFGTALVTLLYVTLNAVFVYSAPTTELAGKLDIGRIAAQALGGPSWADATSLLVALALATSVSSLLMAGPRVYARMAADGYLPGFLFSNAGPPRSATALQSLLALALLWTATYESLLTYIGFTLGLSTAATVVGLIVLKLKHKERLQVPGWPWVPMLFLFGVSAVTLFSILQRPKESFLGLSTIAAGFVGWFLIHKTKAELKNNAE